MSILSRLITRLVGWAVGLYFNVERRGPTLPEGPVLVVANHPNALLDPIVLFRTAGRPTRPLAKAPLFDQALVGSVLKGLGGLPVYRPQDDPTRLDQNERTFEAAVSALRRGEAVQIYPEGQSHSQPSLTPLKTGAARIAFMAEEQSDWTLGLTVVPMGLTYQRKHLFRGHVVATMGPHLEVTSRRAHYEREPRDAVRALTDDFTRALETVTLNMEAPEDQELIEAAESLYSRAKRMAAPRERPSLGERLPRLQEFARGLAWLRANEPEEVERLSESVRRYRRFRVLLGARDAEVPSRYRPLAVVSHSIRQLLILALLTPLALIALVGWSVPYELPRFVVERVKPKHDAVSTYKLATSLLAFPITLVVWVAVAWWFGGMPWALAVLVMLPVAGLAWIEWNERLVRFREDVSVFLRTAPRRRSRERLDDLRRELVEDFDRIAERLPDQSEA